MKGEDNIMKQIKKPVLGVLSVLLMSTVLTTVSSVKASADVLEQSEQVAVEQQQQEEKTQNVQTTVATLQEQATAQPTTTIDVETTEEVVVPESTENSDVSTDANETPEVTESIEDESVKDENAAVTDPAEEEVVDQTTPEAETEKTSGNQSTSPINDNTVSVNGIADSQKDQEVKTINAEGITSNVLTESDLTTNVIWQKYLKSLEGNTMGDIVINNAGNMTIVYDVNTGESIILINGVVASIPKMGSVDVTDDEGNEWNIHNLGNGSFDLQDKQLAADKHAAEEAIQAAILSLIGPGSAVVGGGANLVANVVEGVVETPIDLAFFLPMLGLGFLSAIPVVGILPLFLDGLLAFPAAAFNIGKDLLMTGRTVVNNTLSTITQLLALKTQLDSANGHIENMNVTGSDRDQAVADQAALNNALFIASALGTIVPSLLDSGIQIASTALHAVVEVAFVAAYWALGILSAIPILGIIPLAINGLLLTGHFALNTVWKLADQGRQTVLNGASIALGGLASGGSLLNALGQKDKSDLLNEVYTLGFA
ncbi:hypothetical protein ID741_002710 [Enterococcus sp. AZ103]